MASGLAPAQDDRDDGAGWAWLVVLRRDRREAFEVCVRGRGRVGVALRISAALA